MVDSRRVHSYDDGGDGGGDDSSVCVCTTHV